jgi:hypothetical protein
MPGGEIFGIPVIEILVIAVFVVLWWFWDRARREAGYPEPDETEYYSSGQSDDCE